MRSELSLKLKIALPVLAITLVALTVMTALSVKNNFETAKKSAQAQTLRTAEAYANRIKAELDANFKVAVQLEAIATGLRDSGGVERTKINEIFKNMLVQNKGIFGVWATYDVNTFDGKDSEYLGKPGYEKTGGFGPYWNWGPDGKTLSWENDVSYDGEFFTVPKKAGHPLYMEPYFDEVGGVSIFMTSAVLPVYDKSKKFLGVVGVDMTLEDLTKRVKEAKPFATSDPFLVSTNKKYVTNENKELVGKPFDIPYGKDELTKAFAEKTSTAFSGIDPKDNKHYLVVMVPISLADGNDTWTFFIKTPEDVILADARKMLWTQIALSTGFLLLLALTVTFLAVRISKKFLTLTDQLTNSEQVVTAAIEQLTKVGHNLADASSVSAASIEETVASLEEVTSMVRVNSDNAKQAATLSQVSSQSAKKGEEEMSALLSAMSEISESSKKIEEINAVIDDLAFQTNLLALNASVEAARAGEHGKGFAVVADAVRSLAHKSAEAAKDISQLIGDSVQKIERGTSRAGAAGEVLKEIVVSVQKVSDLNNEIAASSVEQSTGISQISQAMNQLDQSIQSNAASSEEIASAAQEIHDQSRVMQKTVTDMNVVVAGKAA